jgi:hypothetical protein
MPAGTYSMQEFTTITITNSTGTDFQFKTRPIQYETESGTESGTYSNGIYSITRNVNSNPSTTIEFARTSSTQFGSELNYSMRIYNITHPDGNQDTLSITRTTTLVYNLERGEQYTTSQITDPNEIAINTGNTEHWVTYLTAHDKFTNIGVTGDTVTADIVNMGNLNINSQEIILEIEAPATAQD